MNKASIWFLCLAVSLLGALLGLGQAGSTHRDGLNEADAASPAEGALPYRLLDLDQLQPKLDEFGMAQPATLGENFAPSGKPLQRETLTISLGVDQAVEHKALLDAGQSLLYAWAVDGGQVYYDFHGHPPDADPDFFTRYEEGEGSRRAGSILAPYAGEHGWYWLNLEDHPVIIQLEAAGFHDDWAAYDLGK